MRHLREDIQESLTAYLPYLLTAMRLPNWTVDIRPAATNQQASASIDVTYETRYASLALASDWGDLTASQQRLCLVHELLHIFHHPLSDHVDQVLDVHASDPMSAVVKQETEAMVDALAAVIAPHLDLPTGGYADRLEDWLGTRFTTDGVVTV